MNYQGVFFDFDYTLGDSTLPITLGFQKSFEAMGLPAPTTEQVRPTVGMTLTNGYTWLTGDEDPGRREEFYRLFQSIVGEGSQGEFSHVMEEKTVFFPGAVELLRALKARGVKVAIVSTKAQGTIRKILAHNGLVAEDLADLIVGGRDVSHAKPHPEGMLFALDKLGLEADQVLFCGDTVIDAQTARNGGTQFCAVLNGTTPARDFEPYDPAFVAKDLLSLKEWLGLD